MSLLADPTAPIETCPTCGHQVAIDEDEFARSYGFAEFWAIYPRRDINGTGTLVKPGKKAAMLKWGRFPLATKRLIYRAAVNYAAVQPPQFTKDASRFLSAEFWRDWLDVDVNRNPAQPARPSWVSSQAVPDGHGGWQL